MKLGILCSGGLGFSVLKKLEKENEIQFVFTDANSHSIFNFCKKKQIPLFVGNPRKGKARKFTQEYICDILVSVNYLFIVEEDVISMAKILAFNVHGSLLPKYRGRTPHVWAIINGEKEAGITAHIIDKGCDTGDILGQLIVQIDKTDTGNDILLKFRELYTPLIKDILEKVKKEELKPISQNDEKATYFGKRTPEDGEICWLWQKERIYNWVRAQSSPYPGAFSFIEGKKIIIDKVKYSLMGYHQDDPNGLILQDRPSIVVKTPNGALELTEIRNNKEVCKKGKIFKNEQ